MAGLSSSSCTLTLSRAPTTPTTILLRTTYIPSKSNLLTVCSIKREFEVGDHAPSAHQDTRVFPDWYKPYQFNYAAEGYFALALGGIALFGYSYMNDIKEQKGRKTRKVFDRGDLTVKKLTSQRYAAERIEKGDPEFTKFLTLKERSHGHH